MKRRQTLTTVYRCGMALMALWMLGLAAGCAWLLMPPSAARAADAMGADPQRKVETAYLQARLMLANDQPEQAAAVLEKLRQTPDCPAAVYSSLTEAYLRSRGLAKARSVLGEGLKKYPAGVDLLLLQARFDAQDGRIDTALQELDKALTIEPHRQAVLELMSDLRLQKVRQVRNENDLNVQVGELIKVYERMLEARQGMERIPPLLVLSSLYLRTPQKERAVEMAREAVQIRSREPRCYLALATAQEALGRNDEALKTYREVLVLDADNSEARERIEKLLDAQGNPGAKRRFYGDLAREFPDDKQLQVQFAQALVSDKHWAEAERQLKAIIAKWPEEAQSRLELARVWVALKRPEEAVKAVEKLGRENKQIAPLASLSIAEALIAQGERDRALKVLDDFARTNPADNENVTLALASLLLESGENARALKVLEPFHTQHPDVYPASLLLVQVYINQKRYDEAQAVLAAQPGEVKQKKGNDILRLQADLYRRQKKMDKALETFKSLLAKDPDNAALVMETGLTYQELGKNAEAERHYRQAIELAPDDPETYNTLGYFYAETGQKLDEALKLVQKAMAMKPDAGNIADSLGWVYYKQGNYRAAVEALQKAVQLMEKTPDPVVYDHLGDALAKLGRTEEARAAWKKSLALDAESKEVQEKLAKSK